VRITNPDQGLLPRLGITKRTGVEYYLTVADPLLRVLHYRT